MCCLNTTFTFAVLFLWADPYSDDDEGFTWFQILTLPFLILIIFPITIILDLILLPFTLAGLCFKRYCMNPEEINELKNDEKYYDIV